MKDEPKWGDGSKLSEAIINSFVNMFAKTPGLLDEIVDRLKNDEIVD